MMMSLKTVTKSCPSYLLKTHFSCSGLIKHLCRSLTLGATDDNCTSQGDGAKKISVMRPHTKDTDIYAKMFSHQRTNVENFHDIFRQCIDNLKPVNGKILSICDYGAAQGTRSLALFQDSIKYMRERHGPSHPIVVIYNDLPCNDFSSLFKKMTETNPFGRNVSILASGKSMYQKVMPPESMDIIFSSYALMFLSQRPCHIRDGFSYEIGTQEERMKWKNVARKDLDDFLLHRASELKPGGYLIVSSVMSHPERVIRIVALRNRAFESLYLDGIISKDEYEKGSLPTYYRTLEEFRLPFDNSKVVQSGVELISLTVEESIFLEYSVENDASYPRSQYEKEYVEGSLSIIYQTIYECLERTRSETEKTKVIEKLKQRLIVQLRLSGWDALSMPRADIVIRKKSVG